MTPSPLQLAIYSAFASGTGSFTINACAGSGKTTTIVEGLQHLPPSSGEVVFLAFNKSIAEELKARNVPASTFHALLFRELSSRLSKRPKVEGSKCRQLFKPLLSEEDYADYYDIPRLVSLAKNSAFTGAEDNEAWLELIENYDIPFPDNDHAVALADRVLRLSNERLDIIDFDDMLYIPWLKNWDLRRYPVILIDEAQDTNRLQRLLLHRLLAEGGRLIAVGDPHQSIYGFRGAGTDSMSILAHDFRCHSLPLSISYRCASAVVEEAKLYVPSISSWESSPAGSVSSATITPEFLPSSGSAVICRLNRPLMQYAFTLIRAGQSIQYLGRDLSAQFKRMLKKHCGTNCNQATLIARLEAARDLELEKTTSPSKRIYTEDLYNTLIDLAEVTNSIPEVERGIDRIFANNPAASITLCTVHKAKGLEWPTVYLLDADKFMPHPKAREGWPLQQEYNMLYVAITRAKRDLVYLSSGA